jgi:hypothetical protein
MLRTNHMKDAVQWTNHICLFQVHWLVRDQIKEVEELKAEHDEIYNQITGCTVLVTVCPFNRQNNKVFTNGTKIKTLQHFSLGDITTGLGKFEVAKG